MSSSMTIPPSNTNLMVLDSRPLVEIDFSSPNPSPTPVASDSRPNIEIGFSSPNPSPTPVASDSRSDIESGFSSPNPSPTPGTSNSRLGDGNNSSSPNPSPTPEDNVAPNYRTSVETTYLSFYPPPTGTGYHGHLRSYYGYYQPAPMMNHGVPCPGEPSYYPPPPPYDIPACKIPSDRKRRGICCARIVLIITAFAIFTSVLRFVVNFIVRPRPPVVSLTSAIVFSFSVNSTSPTISSDFIATFSFHNPNKRLDIAYTDVSTEINYGFNTIADAEQYGFAQDALTDISKVSRIIEVDEFADADTIKRIEDDLVNGGLVDFQVNLNAVMRFSRIKGYPRTLRVSCPSVKVRFSDELVGAGKMVGPPISCIVHT